MVQAFRSSMSRRVLLTAAGMFAASSLLLPMVELTHQQQLCPHCCSAARQQLQVGATAAAVLQAPPCEFVQQTNRVEQTNGGPEARTGQFSMSLTPAIRTAGCLPQTAAVAAAAAAAVAAASAAVLLLHGTHHCLQEISAAARACGGSKRKMCSRSTASTVSMLTILLRILRDGDCLHSPLCRQT
jgi:hypothetical protein